jgi:tetratricopeptide (TPR) repeat protein
MPAGRSSLSKKKSAYKSAQKAKGGAFSVDLRAQLLQAVSERRIDEAVRALSRLQHGDLDPEASKAAAWTLLARALQGYSTGAHVNAAISDLSLAARHLPSSHLIWFHLGLAYLKAELENKALWAFRKAVDLDPQNSRYTYHAAWAAVAGRSADAQKWIALMDQSAQETRFLKAACELLESKPLPEYELASGDLAASEDGEIHFLESVASSILESQRNHDSRQTAVAGFPPRTAISLDLRPGADHLRRAAMLAPGNAVVQLALGNLELSTGNREAALKHLESATKLNSRNPELVQRLARLYLYQGSRVMAAGERDEGLLLLEKARTLEPDLEPWVQKSKGDFLAGQAYALAGEGKFADAVLLWKQIEAREAGGLPVLHNLALAYEQLKDFEKAAQYWKRWNRARLAQQVGSQDPAFDAEVWRRLAQCFMKADLDNDAADAFRHVLTRTPGDLAAHEALASLCMDAEQWEEALKHLEHLQKSQPESTTRWTQIGYARVMLDDLEGATQAWSRAIELEPGNEAAQAHLVVALEERLECMSAIQYRLDGLRVIQEAIHRMPKHYGPELVLAKYFFGFNYHKKGKEALQRAIELAPDCARAWLYALGLLQRFGTAVDCSRLGERLLREHGGQPDLLGPAGVFFIKHGYRKMAARLFEAAMRCSSSALVPLNIARAYIDAGCSDKALPYARSAVDREPHHPEAHFLQGLIHLELGKEDKAADSLRVARALAVEKGDEDLLDVIGEVEALPSRQKTLFDFLDE